MEFSLVFFRKPQDVLEEDVAYIFRAESAYRRFGLYRKQEGKGVQ
jgi:hypothetical protein